MDTQEHRLLVIHNPHSTVDTSRPFRSVKEAVEIFGERILAGDLYSTKTLMITAPRQPPPLPLPPPPKQVVRDDILTLQKLEAELKDTKRELNLLKERESETEIALASLNAELHKNMSKMAQAEAAAAGSSSRAMVVFQERKEYREEDDEIWEEKTTTKDSIVRSSTDRTSASLAQMLCVDGEEGYFGYNYMKKQKKKLKKKPIVPLIGDFFSRKKSSSSSSSAKLHKPDYPSSHMYN